MKSLETKLVSLTELATTISKELKEEREYIPEKFLIEWDNLLTLASSTTYNIKALGLSFFDIDDAMQDDEEFIDWDDILKEEENRRPKPQCECGATKTGSYIHSLWCPLHELNTKYPTDEE